MTTIVFWLPTTKFYCTYFVVLLCLIYGAPVVFCAGLPMHELVDEKSIRRLAECGWRSALMCVGYCGLLSAPLLSTARHEFFDPMYVMDVISYFLGFVAKEPKSLFAHNETNRRETFI